MDTSIDIMSYIDLPRETQLEIRQNIDSERPTKIVQENLDNLFEVISPSLQEKI